MWAIFELLHIIPKEPYSSYMFDENSLEQCKSERGGGGGRVQNKPRMLGGFHQNRSSGSVKLARAGTNRFQYMPCLWYLGTGDGVFITRAHPATRNYLNRMEVNYIR